MSAENEQGEPNDDSAPVSTQTSQQVCWCAVEKMKEEDWCRANRRHYPKLHLKSSVFSPNKISEEPRCTWSVEKPTHRERRHYHQQYQGEIVL